VTLSKFSEALAEPGDSQASFGYLFQYVREYVVDLRELDFSHTPNHCNRAAIALAKEAYKIGHL
jgi:hypothetical protein